MACVNLNFNVNVNDCLCGLWALLRLSWPKSGIEKLRKEMTLLKSKRDDIKAQIDQAEREGRIPASQVSQWLRDVETLEGQVDAIENDFQNISRFSCHCFKQTQTGGTTSQTQQAGDQTLIRESSNYCSIVRRVAKKLGEPNELMSRVPASDSIVTTPPPEHAVMEDISHRQLIGIKSYVDDIVGYINGGKDNIGIYGMGGVGKTTVLKSIRRHYLLNHTIFDCVIWVVASKDCPLKRLQMDIAKCLKLQTLDENDDEQTCGEKLFIYLKNRNCLLLLDDIWKHLDRKLLGMAHPITEQGQQQLRKIVVFTTRSETVCFQMKAKKKIKVNCLDSVQAWQLFEENSDGDVLSSYAGIKFVAQDLVKECGGLPLALIIVARAMSGKKSLDLWKDALHQMKYKHVWVTTKLSEEDSVDMYNAFKLSYDNLENDSIRECFLCCALWPEDCQIHKLDMLIPCWIGCGIIREFNVINEAFTKGYSHLEALIAASLLEHPSRLQDDYYEEQFVKMHDVIRDMALLMVSGSKGDKRKWIVKAGIGLTRLPIQKEWQEAERASFMMNGKITSLEDYEASTFSKLSMLILTNNNGLTTIPPSLFASMPHLTYLDLSGCNITKLPMEIGCLIELRYLNLSFTDIRRLPLEFGCLNKLEYLLLRSTTLEIIPNGILSNLSMLKWLDIAGNYSESALWLNELKYFEGHHQISLGINIHSANFKRLSMLTNVSVWILKVRGLESSEFPEYDLGTLQWSQGVSDNLEFLQISDAPGDKLMMNKGVGCESSFRYLKALYLIRLGQLKDIRLNGVEFDNLRDLIIKGCPKLKDVSWVLQLPCLNLLIMSNCEEMEELISNVGNPNSSFGIKMLILNGMENLHRIAQHPLHFPCLEHIQVVKCPRLKKLPFGAEILNSRILKKIKGEHTWWDNLDWDDQSNKDSLTPYFR